MISLNIRIVILLATALVGNALDLEFDKIECNDTLAAYAYQDDVHMDCSGDSRCSFGEQALIYGNRRFYFVSLVVSVNDLQWDPFCFFHNEY